MNTRHYIPILLNHDALCDCLRLLMVSITIGSGSKSVKNFTHTMYVDTTQKKHMVLPLLEKCNRARHK